MVHEGATIILLEGMLLAHSSLEFSQRRGMAGRVQPVLVFANQKSTTWKHLEFLSRALQTPESLSVQNAVEYLKIISALDEDENLIVLGAQVVNASCRAQTWQDAHFGSYLQLFRSYYDCYCWSWCKRSICDAV